MRKFGLAAYSVLLLLVVRVLLAQGDCPALVEQALSAVGDNCDGISRNSACYGYNHIDSTFTQAQSADFFTTPADRAQLRDLQNIQTSALDAASSEWGVAVLSVQANIPNTLPGQNVIFFLLGDVKLENEVPAEDTLQVVDPITVTTTLPANIRSGPSESNSVTASAPANSTLGADGLSSDGLWLRVAYATKVGWVSRALVAGPAELDTLPVITEQTRTPMQAFSFSTGIGSPGCEQAPPSLLVVQGPDQFKIDLTVNGVDIELGSTVGLRSLPDEDGIGQTLQLIVLSGFVRVNGLRIPVGYTVTAQTDESGVIIGEWSGLRALSPDELRELLPLENLPANLLNYVLDIPDFVPDQNVNNDGAAPDQPSTGEIVSTYVRCSANANWCQSGGPWGDGRCESSDPDIANYWQQAGWYNAALECGTIQQLPLEFLPPGLREPEKPEFGGVTACSIDSESDLVNINFTNDSSEAVDIFWINFGCGEEQYFNDVPVGASVNQSTFVTHPWIVRNAATGDPLYCFVATTNEAILITDTPQNYC